MLLLYSFSSDEDDELDDELDDDEEDEEEDVVVVEFKLFLNVSPNKLGSGSADMREELSILDITSAGIDECNILL